LKSLSVSLTKAFGKGYSVDNLQWMRRFYLTYQKYETLFHISSSPGPIYETPSHKSKLKDFPFKLTWSHYIILMKIEDDNERSFYEIEAVKGNWSVRELMRQYNAAI